MRMDELDYDLPEDLIATKPADKRDASRLLQVNRSGEILADRMVADLPDIFQSGDLMVVNETRVLPARFHATRLATGGQLEGLFLETRDDAHWLVMLKSGGKLKAGERIGLGDVGELELIDKDETGVWIVSKHSDLDTVGLLDAIGSMPLPPYILKQRKLSGVLDEQMRSFDRDRYQTVYAKQPGAVAAPTAGLHFTDDLLSAIQAKGVKIAKLTLHVGMGTFQPVREEVLEDHPMHQEHFIVPRETLALLKQTRAAGGRIIPIGTTCVRALESLPKEVSDKEDYKADTELMISPGFEFQWTDGLMTNFHLPKSTLLALVSALTGLDELKAIYAHAVNEHYRFYSYGDAMLITP